MTRVQLFPTIMIALSICSAIMYLIDGDYRKAIYWFAAAVLSATVTF